MALDWKDCGDTHEAQGPMGLLYIIYASPHGYRLELHKMNARLLTLGWVPSLDTAKSRAASDCQLRERYLGKG